jgi:methylmalonyl-CoA mutase C-terminal domain/subunit
MVYPESGPDASGRRIRVLVGKAGLDGHDRGVKVVARILRDAGMEVVYTGLHRTPEQIVSAAVQEDVDVVGISLLSGAHMSLIPRILALLRAADAGDIAVVVGGVIPDEDVAPLREMGVAEVFGQDAAPDLIVNRVRELASSRPSE